MRNFFISIFTFFLLLSQGLNSLTAQNETNSMNVYSNNTSYQKLNSFKFIQTESSRSLILKNTANEKSPVLAGILSAILPGSGQVYNGQWIKASVQWVLLTGSIYLMIYDIDFDSESQDLPATSIAGISIGAATWIWSVVDAVISANQINKERKPVKKSKQSQINPGKYKVVIEPQAGINSLALKINLCF